MVNMNNNKRRGCPPPQLIPLWIILGLLAIGGIVMLLWNAILPSLLQMRRISYWEAVGLFLLSRILFGSFHKAPPHHHNRDFIRNSRHLREKVMHMNDEERKAFREKWKNMIHEWRRDVDDK